MVDETDNKQEASPQPVLAGHPGADATIRLDTAIANGNLSLPAHFGRYRVAGRIGIGGFASVYSAHDPELDALVAIKVLAENHSADVAVRKRFVAEARVARRLGSERLIGVFDLGETNDGRPFVVMELAERGTLRQRVVRTGRPTPADLLRLIDELAACMTALHDQGVVHRDIKPSNLLFRAVNPTNGHQPTDLINDDERLVLGDLGLARDISDGASALTVGGGTEGYMAPEQADPRGKADYRADIYSATVVLAELTTGRHPQRLDLPSADIPTEVLEALAVSLSPDREKRPPTAAAWRDRILDAYRGLHNVGDYAPPTGQLTTAHLDPTEIKAPYPYNTEAAPATDVPHTGMPQPQSFVGRPGGDRVPPPPPSLPLHPSRQPPPPRLAEQSMPQHADTGGPTHHEPPANTPPAANAHLVDAHPADPATFEARSTLPAAAPTAIQAESAPHTAADPATFEARSTLPAADMAAIQAESAPHTAADTAAPTAIQAESAPHTAADTAAPTAIQAESAPHTAANSAAPTAIRADAPPAIGRSDAVGGDDQFQPVSEPPKRPSRPHRSMPVAATPATQAPGATQPSAGQTPLEESTPVPAGPIVAPERLPSPDRVAADVRPATRPGSATPRAPGRGTLGGPPVVARPARSGRRRKRAVAKSAETGTPPPTTPGETAEARSKKHLKTAERLAKLERKQNRRLARKARRRRRRLRVANFVLSLIRGVLAAVITWFSGLVISSAALGVRLSDVGDAIGERPGTQVLLIGATLLAFLWGLAYFPFPRSYEI